MKKISFSFFLIITILFIFCFPNSSYSKNINKIDVTIDSSQRTIQGTNEITFTNTSNDSLDKIYLYLGLNNSYDTKAFITEIFSDDGTELTGRFYTYNYLGKQIEDKTIFEILIPSRLGKNESIVLKVGFQVNKLSKINDILFLDDNLKNIYLGCWYPKLMNYVDGIWEKENSTSDNYEVNISLANNETILSSAIELSNDSGNYGQKKVGYKINNIRGFSLVIGSNLTFDTIKTKEGITIKHYYKNNKKSKWNSIITDNANEIISFYYEKFGFYPYKQLNIVSGNSLYKEGYSNNNIIILPELPNEYAKNKNFENFLGWCLAYNISQQYFGYLVNESDKYPKWITTGASLYISDIYTSNKIGTNSIIENYVKEYLSATKAGFNTKILQPKDILEKTNFDWVNVIENGKSIIIFKMLENIIGRKYLQDSLKKVLNTYSNSFITTDKFQNIIENISGKKLDWFFNQWVREDKYLDYAIVKIIQEEYTKKYRVTITLKRFGDVIMPVPIAVTLKNGEKVFELWDGKDFEKELVFEYKQPVKTIQVAPSKTLPDINRTDNQINATRIIKRE